jgi:hypothetical protein
MCWFYCVNCLLKLLGGPAASFIFKSMAQYSDNPFQIINQSFHRDSALYYRKSTEYFLLPSTRPSLSPPTPGSRYLSPDGKAAEA